MMLTTRSLCFAILGLAIASCSGDTSGASDSRGHESGGHDSSVDDQSQNPCRGVVCTTPPADSCKDATTLVEHQSPGTCNATSGRCEYTTRERTCKAGCAAGACTGEKSATGWIAVEEYPADYPPQGVVDAFLAKDFREYRSLPHHVDRYMVLAASAGACKLYEPTGTYSLCQPPCNLNEECVKAGGDGGSSQFKCQLYPNVYQVGKLTMSGLKTKVEITPDSFKLYRTTELPVDLFDKGAAITASASGGELDPFTLSATGVAPLAGATSVVTLIKNAPATVTWTPADPSSRVQLVLNAGNHSPSLPIVALVCDAADSAGQIVIPASLVDGFRSRAFLLMQLSWLKRYTSQIKQPFGKPLELFVAHAVPVWISKP